MPILWVFESDVFFCSERLVCYIKRRKSFFHDYFHDRLTTCSNQPEEDGYVIVEGDNDDDVLHLDVELTF